MNVNNDDVFNIKCGICEKDYKTEKEYNKHIRGDEHEQEKVKKGLYSFGGCPYCRQNLYILAIPTHIKEHHKEYADEWKDIQDLNDVKRLLIINNKLKEIKQQKEPENKKNTQIKQDAKKEQDTNNNNVKHRRGKYRHMTEDEIKQHKRLLTKERQRKFYEKNRKHYKLVNIENYKKRKSKTEKKRGRPPVYKE